MGDTWINQVRVKLAKLAKLDADKRVFGADTHEYKLNQPISINALERFERAHQLQLPADYRSFLHKVGNGGVGPAYGLAPLAPWQPEEFDDSGRPADPAMPFRLTESWRPVDEDGNENAPPGPADANPYDGCMFLAEIGCGYLYFLVINGERSGQVWADYTAGDGELCAVFDSFREWYESWLDAELAEQLLLQVHAAFDDGPDWQADDDVLAWAHIFEGRVDRVPDSCRAMENLAYLRVYQRRFDDAAKLIEQLAAPQFEAESECLDDLRYLLHRRDIDAARDPETDKDTLATLATSTVDEVRRAAAGNASTGVDVIAALIQAAITSEAAERKRAIDLELYARHPSLTPSLFDKLLSLDDGDVSWSDAVVRTVARHPALPAQEIDRLARHSRPWIREAASGNDSTPSNLLTNAATDDDVMVRRAVALHPRTDPAVLAKLAKDKSEPVRIAVASNPRTPAAAMVRLVRTGVSPILHELAENPNLPSSIAECLAHFSDSWVRRIIARHPNLPPLVRRKLARDEDSDVRAGVTLALDVDEVTLRLLLTDEREEVRAAAAVNPITDASANVDASEEALLVASARSPHTPAELLVELASHSISHVREAVAQNPAAPADVLSALADDELMFVRDAVPTPPRQALRTLRMVLADPRAASDADVPVVALPELAARADDLVPYAVAAHPWADSDVLDSLSGHSYSYTRMRVAEHTNVSQRSLERLRTDDAAMVRAAVARNPKTPADWLADFASDPEDTVREAAALRPDVEPKLLHQLAGDDEKYVRRGICRNPRAPAELVAKLATDSDSHVREWALRRHALPAQIIAQLLEDKDSSVARVARFRELVEALE